ncbi:MAG TPA: glycosyltransferase family 4 protein [Chthonomonadaceae bacterium]|nr:glycosyltransferase family 4 protein [Chthonomonadaceae bacterium]
MNVLLFTTLYPSSRRPARGLFNLQSFRALAQYCEARVVVPVPWWQRLRWPGDLLRIPQEDDTGLPASVPTYWPVPHMPATHVRAMHRGLAAHLRQLRRDFPFDLLFATFAYPDGVAAAYLARDLQCPLVIGVLGSDVNLLAARPSLRPEIQWGLQQAQRVLAVSSALRERVIELGVAPEKVVVQRNGVDGEQFALRDRREARVRLGLPADRRIVCCVGNLLPVKGQDVLVEAMGLLRDGPCVDLVLIGAGEMQEALQARVRALGLEGRIHLPGRRPHGEVPDWISACDVYCLPSRREGCPNVILEALASGRPVVASCVGGVPELINAGNGILVPAENPVALAEGLRQALSRSWDPETLRGSVEYLSWDQAGKGYFHVLQAALREERTRVSASGPRPGRSGPDL